ncbi:MAG: tetratricopeptide repeat protein [Gemmataceae bacterium]
MENGRLNTVRLFLRRPFLSLLAVSFLLLCFMGAKEGIQYSKAWYHKREARKALEARDFSKASYHFNICLELTPGNAGTHFLAAQAARRDGDLDTAEQHLLACQKLDDVIDDVTLEWALLLAQRGKLAEVEEYLRRRASELGPAASPILEVLTWEYLKQHRLSEATQFLNAWLVQEPNNDDAWVCKGWIAEHLFEHTAALEAYGKALEFSPDRDNVRFRIGEILLKKNRADEALVNLQQVHERRPEDPDVVVALARCNRQLGKLDEADALLKELLETHPRHCLALSEQGLVALAIGKPEQAEELLRRAMQYGPQDRQVLFNMYQCLEKLDKKEEAAQVQAKLREMEADLKRMTQVMQDVLKRPHDPALRCEAGRIFLRNGFKEDGLRWLGTALQEDPHHQLTHQTLADYYDQAGDKELAEVHRSFAEKK